MFFYILIALGVILIVSLKWRFTFWKRKGLQTPPSIFLLGNLVPNLIQKDSFGVLLKRFYDYFKSRSLKHGGIYMFWMPTYIPVDIEIIKSIMQTDFQHFVDRGMYMNEKVDPLSAHLFSLEGTKWKNLRNKITPTFTSGKMKMMFQTLVNCSEGLTGLMDASIGAPIDIKDVLARFTCDIIGSVGFGIECNSLRDPENDFLKHGKAIIVGAFKGFLAIALPGLLRFVDAPLNKPESSKFFLNVIADTVRYRETNNIFRKDFMHLLIELKNKEALIDDDIASGEGDGLKSITFNELAAQAFLFFLAGFETSSTTMTFCLYELALNSDLQTKVRDEVNEVLNKHGGRLTYDSVGEMHYMEKAINETLRKYPPLPMLNRVCTKTYKVPNTDVILEKGTKVIIPIYGLHYDEQYYPNPQKFDPERFSEENIKSRPHYTHLPFGEGPRICIGLRFGMMQSKVGLAVLLQNYEFSVSSKTTNPLKLDPKSMVISAKGGIWLNYKKLIVNK